MSIIKVLTSSKFISEKRYVFDFVFQKINLSWEYVEVESELFTSIVYKDRCILKCTNDFWIRANAEWLKDSLIPVNLKILEVPNDFGLGEKDLPILFGDNAILFDEDKNLFDLKFDLFGTIFFILTGYEERVQDFEGERFPFEKSILKKFNLIERPVVDEYIWILSFLLLSSGVFLPKKTNSNSVFLVSCDVDNPFAKRLNPLHLFSNALASFIRTGRFGDFGGVVTSLLLNDTSRDFYFKGIFKIMEINEKNGHSVTFNFIPFSTSLEKDGTIIIPCGEIDYLAKSIIDRGHKIGIHPGFYSYCNGELMASSFKAFRNLFESYLDLEIKLTGRQHYLNWKYSNTDRLLRDNNLYEDSSLGFAESIGFRCGTSQRFKIYDYEQRCELDIFEQPLIVMEDSLLSKRYMNLGYSEEAYFRVKNCFDKCKKFNGKMSLLWHNCHLGTGVDVDFYSEILSIS